MTTQSRRQFLKTAAIGTTLLATGSQFANASAKKSKRKFTIDLVCGAVGIKADQPAAIQLAGKHGFESIQPIPQYLANLTAAELKAVQASLKEQNLIWGAAGLPVDFRRDDATFQKGLKELPRLSAALQKAGGTRVSTWIRPSHNSLTYLANFKQHARRLQEVAKVLADNGQRFGLEYVGPKLSWTGGNHSFIHTMAETKELIAEINVPTVGFVLDSWHWYTANETEADLLTLTNKDVVACDLNDAPAGIPRDKQYDLSRELPAATGVIDVKTFLTALVKIGYDGPVRAEPFNKPLNALENDPAAAKTVAAIQKAFSAIE